MNREILLVLFTAFFLFNSCSETEDGHGTYTGVVEGTTVQIPALTGGQIVELLVDTGEGVQAGEKIARVDTLELFYRKQELQAAMEELAVQKQIAETNLNRTENDLDYIRQKYERFKELLQQESVSQQRVDDLANRLQSAESAFRAAQQQLRNLNARRLQLNAQFKSLRKKISDATIRSPITGIISETYYEAGEAIAPANPIAEVIRLDEVWVKIYVSETLLPHINVGQPAQVIPDGTKERLTAKVSWISPKAEFTPKTILTKETRTSLVYAVKITIPNPERILKQGMPVEIRI